MGKRSDYEHKRLAFYPTPKEAIIPLIKYLPPNRKFCEPCAGDGTLIKHMENYGHFATIAYDVEPRAEWILQHDAVWLRKEDICGADLIITNPPWERTVLHQIIERCAALAPTWLLFDADWMHTRQASSYLKYCLAIVSIGRVKWIENSAGAGKDNCCWYLFDQNHNSELFPQPTRFYGK